MVLTADSFSLTIGDRCLIDRLSFGLDAGAMALVTGPPGSGKTALGYSCCGLAEYLDGDIVTTGGLTLFGSAVVQGRYRNDTGIVLDNPYVQISGMKSTVAEELGFSLECRGVSRGDIARKVDMMLDRLDIARLADRSPRSLSGGELQRVVIGATLIAEPGFLFLDRPLTEIDTGFRADMLGLFDDHLCQYGGTALLAEDPWLVSGQSFAEHIRLGNEAETAMDRIELSAPPGSDAAFATDALTFAYPGEKQLIEELTLSVPTGGVVILSGPNGAGKTTLAKLAAGILTPSSGSVRIAGRDISSMNTGETMSSVGFAPQNPDVVLCRRTVREELALAAAWGNDPAPVAGVLGLDALGDCHPLELTRAEKKRLGVALAYGPQRRVIFLDEPTQYQDAAGFMQIMRAVAVMAGEGIAVVIISHDPRLRDALGDVPVIRLSRADTH